MTPRRALLTATCLLAAAACGRDEGPRPVPPPTAAPAPASDALKPLSSRDGAPSSEPLGGPSTLPPGHPPIDSGMGSAADTGPSVSGSVSLSPSLASRKGTALFLIARNAKSQQIVAVRKEDASRFPVPFSISGADAMTEGTSFEGPLDLLARLSQTGDAIPAKGDIEGVARGLKPGQRDVRIVLDSVRQ